MRSSDKLSRRTLCWLSQTIILGEEMGPLGVDDARSLSNSAGVGSYTCLGLQLKYVFYVRGLFDPMRPNVVLAKRHSFTCHVSAAAQTEVSKKLC